ncbi:hypothetical protein [Streptomyces sp. NPDC048200]|uniref:hypothetical protein n=1 Tax=Streptomyces sp. NPDC048200 TaxID=3365512 RepID=UPI003716573E
MTTDTDGTARRDREDHKLRVVLLLLTIVVGLLITGAAIYVARMHPALVEPLGVGAAVVSALAGVAGVIGRALRR